MTVAAATVMAARAILRCQSHTTIGSNESPALGDVVYSRDATYNRVRG